MNRKKITLIASVLIILIVSIVVIIKSINKKEETFDARTVLNEFQKENNYKETLTLRNIDSEALENFIEKEIRFDSEKEGNFWFKDRRGSEIRDTFIGADYEFTQIVGDQYIRYNDPSTANLVSDKLVAYEWLSLQDNKISKEIPGIDDMLKNFENEKLKSLVRKLLENGEVLDEKKLVETTENSMKYDITNNIGFVSSVKSIYANSVSFEDDSGDLSGDIYLTIHIAAGKLSGLKISFEAGELSYEISEYDEQSVEVPI